MTFRPNTLARAIRTSTLALTTAAVLAAPALAHASAGPITPGQKHMALESTTTPAANVAFLAAHGVLASLANGHLRLVF